MAKTLDTTKPVKIKESVGYRVFQVFNTILMIIICLSLIHI